MRNRQSDKTFARGIQSRRTQTHPSNEHGQAIVIIALAMIAIIAFAGLVFDGGTAYAERRRMQNAAEAGAMAGAFKLAYGGPNISNIEVCMAIRGYAMDRNAPPRYAGQTADFIAYYIDINGNQVAGQQLIVKDCGNPGNPPSNAIGVVVTPTTTFNTFFMNVLGMPVGSVNATAKAVFTSPNNVTNLSPILPKCLVPNPSSLLDCGFKPDGTLYNLWDGGGPGNFGWANWANTNDPKTDPICSSGGGTGSPQLCENIRHPETMVYTHNCNPLPDTTISVGDCVDATTGVKNTNDVRDALISLVGPPPIPITVPIWSVSNGTGNNVNYTIVMFATFVVTGFYLPQGGGGGSQYGNASQCFTGGLANGSGNCIVGKFVSPVGTAGSSDGCLPPTCIPKDSGTRVVTLIPN